jgi:hypothetical protein
MRVSPVSWPRRTLVTLSSAVAATALLIPVAHAAAAPPAGAIRVLPGPVEGVDTLASNDAWVVGSRPDPADGDENIGLALHWNGRHWIETPTPPFGELTGGLADVSMSDADHGFAVGNKGIKGFRDQQIVVEQWNGTRWKLDDAPDQSFNDVLTGVVTISADDAWAVGAWDPGGTARNRPLAEHWDGHDWSIVALPDVGASQLVAVDAIASNDVWAVGESNARTLTLHWNGSTWRRVDSPNTGQSEQGLVDVSAVSSGDIWAVGTVETGDPFPGETLALHWDGSAWSVVDSPSPKSGDEVGGVAAFPGDEAWMVGTYWPDAVTDRALTAHFSGGQVRLVKIRGKNSLDGVDGVAADDVWAIGTGIFRFRGHGWHLVVPAP